MGTEAILLFIAGLIFSFLLYGGEYVPWWLSVFAGILSVLFLTVLGLTWIGSSYLPEAGWLFILWGVINFILSLVLLLMGIRLNEKTRFD